MDRDRFAQFVAAVASSLAGSPAEDLAGRLHLSRSHLDRIVRAASGETPAAFRRRVLLERAAYELRSSGASILDAAVRAGYSSHEAFSRAFTRAYGVAPSAWRSSARSFHVPAPNGLHFFPPGGLRMPGAPTAKETYMISDMVDHHIAQVGVLLDRASGLTPEQLHAPLLVAGGDIDPEPTIRSLLAALIAQLERWLAAMASVPYEPGSELPDAERLAAAGSAFSAYVRETEARAGFGETFVDATGETPYVFTAAGMISHVLTYAAYRRTLLVGVLAAAGAPDIDDDPLTWFGAGR